MTESSIAHNSKLCNFCCVVLIISVVNNGGLERQKSACLSTATPAQSKAFPAVRFRGPNLWSRITKYISSLHLKSTKCSRPRLDCFCIRNNKNMSPPGTKTRIQSSLYSKPKPHGINAMWFWFILVPPGGIEPPSKA